MKSCTWVTDTAQYGLVVLTAWLRLHCRVWCSGYNGERPHCVEHHKLMVCNHDTENTVLSYACGWIWRCHLLECCYMKATQLRGGDGEANTHMNLYTHATHTNEGCQV